MTMLTIEMARQMSNEELHGMYWDWFKEVSGFRPRHVCADDRETMLSFIEYELRPEVQEKRKLEWAEESKMIEEMA